MTEQHKKQIRRLMEDQGWDAVEAFFDEFMTRNFVQGSIKRQSEFETVWYAAEHEGGKRFLMQFMRELEESAQQSE